MFNNRQEAGKLLGDKIANELLAVGLPDAEQFVIGVGRGGIMVAAQVADKLMSPLSAFAVESIKSIDEPERDIAIVSSSGLVYYDNKQSCRKGEQSYLGHQVRRLAPKARESQQLWLFRAGLENQPELRGKRVIIVEDGIITDMLSQMAVMAVRRMGASEIILAAPVISNELMAKLGTISDNVVALFTPAEPESISQLYDEDQNMDDVEVIRILTLASQRLICV